jgi:hypothetical protein
MISAWRHGWLDAWRATLVGIGDHYDHYRKNTGAQAKTQEVTTGKDMAKALEGHYRKTPGKT